MFLHAGAFEKLNVNVFHLLVRLHNTVSVSETEMWDLSHCTVSCLIKQLVTGGD